MEQEPIHLGMNNNFVMKLLGSPNRVVIGSGGYGTVITTLEHPELALKISNKVEVCKEWMHEYAIQQKIYNSYNSASSNVRVARPIKYAYITGGRCYILMDRICPPLEYDASVAVHALVGEIDMDYIHPKRGKFIGQEMLQKYIDLEKLAVDLGKFLATVHFKLGLDAKDLEYILGNSCDPDTTYRVHVIDFGMVDVYERDRAVESIIDVAYFPLKDACEYAECTDEQKTRNEHLANLFINSYVQEAAKYGMENEASKVIDSLE